MASGFTFSCHAGTGWEREHGFEELVKLMARDSGMLCFLILGFDVWWLSFYLLARITHWGLGSHVSQRCTGPVSSGDFEPLQTSAG